MFSFLVPLIYVLDLLRLIRGWVPRGLFAVVPTGEVRGCAPFGLIAEIPTEGFVGVHRGIALIAKNFRSGLSCGFLIFDFAQLPFRHF